MALDAGWKDYLLNLPQRSLTDVEIDHHAQRLCGQDTQLFSGQGDIEMWSRDEMNGGIDACPKYSRH